MSTQDAIRQELERQGKTPYWLAVQCEIHPSSIYRKLERPTFSTAIDSMLDVLGLVVVPREFVQSEHLPKPARRVSSEKSGSASGSTAKKSKRGKSKRAKKSKTRK